MRKKFEPQLVLGCTSIANVQIPTKSRDEFPPFLRAMQHIFLDKELSSLVFNLLETSICAKQPTGRQGMDLWTLFVLAEARLCLNTDYDDLHYRSNYDLLLRQILDVHDGILVLRTKYEVVRGREFDLQVIKDNVKLLDEKTLREINKVIVRAGHHLVQKKEPEALRILVLRTKYAVKIDSFVTEANVHFPTDYFVLRTKYKYNLLWDSGRKCLDVLGHLMLALCAAHVETDTAYCTGWRKIEYWRKHMKNNMLKLSRTTADKSKNRGERIKKASDEYLHTARSLSVKLSNVKQLNSLDLVEGVMFKQLAYYREMLDKHIDLVERRLVKGEKIPHEEKIFSIFEPWVEWICKGKARKPVEIGKRTCIASDQWHFMLDWWVADHQQDNEMLLPVIPRTSYTVQVDRIRKYYEKISSCSSDKGFFSKIDVEILELFEIKAIIPKKGKRSLVDLQKENDPKFIKAKRSHSAVESNINELEHRGLDRCPDRGIKGMHRYVGLSVIAYFVLRTKYKYNLRRIGQILLEKDRKEAEKATKLRQAA